MEKLLSDVQSWDQEKEDIWKKREEDRAARVEEIKKERAAAKEQRRLAREAEAAAAEEEAAKSGDDEDGEKAEAKPEEARPETVEEPIKVVMEGDSDDEFAPIAIKEKVLDFLKENKDARIPTEIINEAVRWRLNRNDC